MRPTLAIKGPILLGLGAALFALSATAAPFEPPIRGPGPHDFEPYPVVVTPTPAMPLGTRRASPVELARAAPYPRPLLEALSSSQASDAYLAYLESLGANVDPAMYDRAAADIIGMRAELRVLINPAPANHFRFDTMDRERLVSELRECFCTQQTSEPNQLGLRARLVRFLKHKALDHDASLLVVIPQGDLPALARDAMRPADEAPALVIRESKAWDLHRANAQQRFATNAKPPLAPTPLTISPFGTVYPETIHKWITPFGRDRLIDFTAIANSKSIEERREAVVSILMNNFDHIDLDVLRPQLDENKLHVIMQALTETPCGTRCDGNSREMWQAVAVRIAERASADGQPFPAFRAHHEKLDLTSYLVRYEGKHGLNAMLLAALPASQVVGISRIFRRAFVEAQREKLKSRRLISPANDNYESNATIGTHREAPKAPSNNSGSGRGSGGNGGEGGGSGHSNGFGGNGGGSGGEDPPNQPFTPFQAPHHGRISYPVRLVLVHNDCPKEWRANSRALRTDVASDNGDSIVAYGFLSGDGFQLSDKSIETRLAKLEGGKAHLEVKIGCRKDKKIILVASYSISGFGGKSCLLPQAATTEAALPSLPRRVYGKTGRCFLLMNGRKIAG